MMKRILSSFPVRTGLAVCLGTVLASCASSTRLDRSWVAPQAGTISFHKVMVLAMTPDEALRRSTEDAMRQQVQHAEVVTSYEAIPKLDELTNRMRVAQAIRAVGADGLVVMRFVSDQDEVSYVPGNPMPPPYTSFWGYYTRGYALSPFYWHTGYSRTDRIVGIETNIYNAHDESLIWSGFTRTRDPRNVQQLVADVADAVRNRLREQGLVPER